MVEGGKRAAARNKALEDPATQRMCIGMCSFVIAALFVGSAILCRIANSRLPCRKPHVLGSLAANAATTLVDAWFMRLHELFCFHTVVQVWGS